MAGVVLQLDDREVQRALDGLAGALADMRPVMAGIGEVIHSQAMDAFETGESPGGEPWEVSHRAQAEGGQTLVDTGRLRESLGVEAWPDRVEVGTDVVYAAIHQFGGRAGRGLAAEIPARPFLPDGASLDLAEIQATILDYLAEAAR